MKTGGRLSRRQRQVAVLIRRGLTNTKTPAYLRLSPHATPIAFIVATVMVGGASLSACQAASTSDRPPAATSTPASNRPTAVYTTHPTQVPTPAVYTTLQGLIDVIVSGDATMLKSRVIAVPTECGVRVICPRGSTDGEIRPVIRATGCELLNPDELEGGVDGTFAWFASVPRTLVAVYLETGEGDYHDWVPRGRYGVLVWSPAMTTGAVFQVDGGAIVGVRFGCGVPPERQLQSIDPARLLAGPFAYVP